MAACCAGAESGHAAAPPTSVMNARRLIVAPRGQNHAPHRLTAVRVLERDERGANCDQLFWAGNVGFESHDRGQNRKSSKSANVFRFASESGLQHLIAACRMSANRVLTRRNKKRCYSITSSAMA